MGNEFSLKGDMVRRSFFACLFKKWENAKGKDFSIEQEAENPGERK